MNNSIQLNIQKPNYSLWLTKWFLSCRNSFMVIYPKKKKKKINISKIVKLINVNEIRPTKPFVLFKC